MKNFLIAAAVAMLSVPAMARDFAYTYEGQTLNYTVLDEDERTCQVMAGDFDSSGYIVSGHNISGDLIIPSTASDGTKEYTVIGVGDYALECPEITSLILPPTLKEIGVYSFYGCKAITTIDIPKSVKKIGEWAFTRCEGLTKVQFASVEDLCTIDFANIGANPLHNCGHIYVDGEEITEIVVPEGITVLRATFPYCASLTSVTLPSTLTSIEEWCFSFCTGLTSIEIPEKVSTIGSYVFYFCTGLTQISLPEAVTSIGTGAFQICRNLRSINIPDAVQTIGAIAFQNCESLESIKLPETITEIPKYAFSDCFSLQEFNIPAGVTFLGEGALARCENIKSLVIPEGVTEILKNTFQYCHALETIEILGPVTLIGENAFSTCSNLRSFTIPETVTEIGKNAFGACPFTSIYIPASVKKIDSFAFGGCDKLEQSNFASIEALCNIEFGEFYASPVINSHNIFIDGQEISEIVIPEGVKTIHRTFDGASGLTSVTIPNSVEKIESYSFQNCTSLTSIVIPNSVTEIEPHAFRNCEELKNLTISTSLEKLGGAAFEYVSKLENVYYLTTEPKEFDDWIFSNFDATLHVAPGGVEAAKSVKPWCYFAKITDDVSAISLPTANNDTINYEEPYEVYSTSGIRLGNDKNTLSTGLYIIRQGANTAKISVQ